MFVVGQIITLYGLTGKISEVHKNNKIGFAQENDRETKYNILFEDIPEHLINDDNGTDTRDPAVPSPKEGDSGEREG